MESGECCSQTCSTQHFCSAPLACSLAQAMVIQTKAELDNKTFLTKVCCTIMMSSVYDFSRLKVDLVAGGGAGAISRTLMAPLERVKVLLQVQEVSLVPQEQRYRGILDCFFRIPKEQGILAFWRGNGVNVARMVPNSAIKFSTFDMYKRLAFPQGEAAYNSTELYLRKMVCGGLSGLSTLLPLYPMDVARTRLTADVATPRQYSGLVDCFRKTVQIEGIQGLYQGIGISLTGIIPYLAISLAMYDTLKDIVKKHNPEYSNHFVSRLVIGSVAAVVSQTIAYPLDTVRRHMQVSGGLGQKSRYKNTFHCIRKIYAKSGLLGFYRGVLANGIRAAPQAGIEYAFYDLIKDWLNQER